MTNETARLTPQEEAFALAMADPTCKGITDAYARAGYSMNLSPRARNSEAWQIANRPHVARRIDELRAAAAERVLEDAASVLGEWVAIATADPAEIVQLRRNACRYCYGEDHAYHWVDEAEYLEAVFETERYNARRKRGMPERDMPQFGGVGFTPHVTPHRDCPKCHGDGVLETWFADTRDLSPKGRKLFAGVKQTAAGLEVKMRDQDEALSLIAKYLGMMVERHAHGGDANNPTPIPVLLANANLSGEEAEALYKRLVSG